MTHRVHRQIRITGAADGAKLRTASLYGDDHLVVPVVALLGDAVVRPLNSRGPEFVPAEELARSTHQWAGRPVVPDHPHEGRASANDPTVLESMGFGQTFHPRFEEGKLKLEAWLSLKRAAALGGDAERVVARARAGEMIEVSVGAWVSVLEAPGVSPSGQNYQFRWSEIDSDHLAMLPEGTEGACSVDMGCGAPRAARRKKENGMNRGLLTRLFQSLGLRVAEHEGMSDADLRGALFDALRAVEPGFDGIVEVFPAEGIVIYAAFPEEEFLFLRRSFEVDEEGAVSLADDSERVEPVTRFEPVAAGAEGEDSQDSDANRNDSEPVAAEGCGCDGKQAKQGQLFRAAQDDDNAAATAEGEPMAKIKELVGRLVDHEKSPYTEEDGTVLSGFSEDRLVQLLSEFEEEPEEKAEGQEATEPEPKPEPQAEPEPDPNTVQLKREEYQRLLAATEAHEAAEQAKKDRLVGQLKGAQSTYAEAELKGMSVEQLQKTAALLKLDEAAPDYSGKGLPVAAASDDLSQFAPPDTYGLRAAKDKKEAN